MKNRFVILLTIVLSGCGVGDSQEFPGTGTTHAEAPSTRATDWTVDPVNGAFGRVEAGMSEAKLSSLGLPMKWGEQEQEGATYKVVTVTAPGDITIECVLSDQIVYRCSSESAGLHDPAGVGVGSSLGELKRAYPHGHLLVTHENGRNANFILGGKMMFSMDVRLINEECFELKRCVFDEEALRVVRIVITDV